MKKNILSMAALLMASAAVFTACSNDDDSIINESQPAQGTKTYTMTIQASKGDDATTRGLYFADEDKKNLQVNWNGTEKVRVVQDGKVIGTLSAAMSNGENGHMTTLTGTVTEFAIGRAVGFYLLADENGKMDYTGQKGAMLDENGTGNIEENYDFASYELDGNACQQAFTTDGTNIVPKDGVYIPFTSQQAIVRFELQKSKDDLGKEWEELFATKFIVTDKVTDKISGKLVKSIDTTNGSTTYGNIVLTPSNTTGYVFNVALNLDAENNTSDIRLFASDDKGNLYTYEKSNVTFEKGKYYRVKVKMRLCPKFPLKDITSEDTQFTGWYIGTSIIDGNDDYAYKQYVSGAKGVIAYVGKVPGYFDNFLAMAMHDTNADGEEGSVELTWTDALNAVGNYAGSHPIVIDNTTYATSSHGSSAYDRVEYHIKVHDTDPEPDTYPTNTATGDARQGWRLPTVTDWRYVFEGLCGSPSATDPVGITQDRGPYAENTATFYSTLNSKARNMVESGCYWTGSDQTDTYAWYFDFNQESTGVKGFSSLTKTHYYYVRPVFAY